MVIKGGQTGIEELCVAPVLGVKGGSLKLKLSAYTPKNCCQSMKDTGGNLGTPQVWRFFKALSSQLFPKADFYSRLYWMVSIFHGYQFIHIHNCSPTTAATFSLLQIQGSGWYFLSLMDNKLNSSPLEGGGRNSTAAGLGLIPSCTGHLSASVGCCQPGY